MSPIIPFPTDTPRQREFPQTPPLPSRFRIVTAAMVAEGCEHKAIAAVRCANVLTFPNPLQNHDHNSNPAA